MNEFSSSGLTAGQIAALRDLDQLARTSGCSLMLIGATARLVQLDWVLGLAAGRTTKDVDFVVHVASWAKYDAIMRSATELLFSNQRDHPHRLQHRSTRTLVDLVPFGALETPPGTLRWPTDDRVMTVCGLHEAEAVAGTMEIQEGLAIRVVSLPCFVLLKIFAWNDRQDATDLQDADFVLRECIRLPQFEQRSWEAYGAALEIDEDLDYTEHVGAAVIGQHLAPLLHAATREALRPILDNLRSPYGRGIEHLLPTSFRPDEARSRRLTSKRYEVLYRLLA